MDKLDVPTLGLFTLVVLPGLLSIAVYRLVMPARAMDWANAVLQALFYSALNFALLLLPLYWLLFGYDPLRYPGRYVAAGLLALFVGPVVWPLVVRALFRSRWVAERINIPYPTAWDFFFDRRETAFVLVHLTNGALLGGYWGKRSYAGSFPNDGDIYIQAVYHVAPDGKFGDPVPGTRGVLLRKEQYSYLELFAVPKSTGA